MISPRYFYYLTLLFIVALLGLLNRKKVSKRYIALTVLVTIVFLSEVLSRILALKDGSSMPIYHVLAILECVLYWNIYKNVFRSKSISFLYLATGIICISNSLFVQELSVFPTNSMIALSFAVITSALFHLKRMLEHADDSSLLRNPDFWFNIGTIFFFSITFFAFGLMNIGMHLLPYWIYDLIYAANIVLYTCYGVSIYLNSQIVTK